MLRIIRKNMRFIIILLVAFFGISIFYGLGQYRSSGGGKRTYYIAEVNESGITSDQLQNAFLNAISQYDDAALSSEDRWGWILEDLPQYKSWDRSRRLSLIFLSGQLNQELGAY